MLINCDLAMMTKLIWLIIYIVSCDAKLILQDKLVRTVDVQAVEGMMAQFPCELGNNNNDKVYMVFWFRDDVGIPLYSFDVRGKHLSEARHWSAPEVFGPRAHFVTNPEPASLVVRDVKRRDEGVYRCRVDFRNTQTMSFRYNLTVIVPPEKPVVVDRRGKILNTTTLGPYEEGEDVMLTCRVLGVPPEKPVVVDRRGKILNTTTLGPYEEGEDVMLTCRVLGGRPEPKVHWLVNGVLVDEEYEHNTGDVIENRLLWPAIRRQDYAAVFTCQATNTNMVPSRETSLILDMFLRPLTVEIKKPKIESDILSMENADSLTADRRYEISCTSIGSRPPAQILWYKGKKLLKRTREEFKENMTISELSFVPTPEDDGKSITCRTENPNVTSLFMESSWTISVVYPPQVRLKLGSTLSADDIKEGDDVYFECNVKANPPWRKLTWYHNDVPLAHNTSARIIRSNVSLVLQKVTRFSSGRYACSVLNTEGETVSNELNFRVKYSPSCRENGVSVVGAARGESVLILCEVDADPPASVFKWKFNNSGETLDVGADKYTSNGSTSSLRYTPVADLDYGTLSCSASNAIGHQKAPCVFQMVVAGKPHPVRNCTVMNQTTNSAEIYCLAGFDGGLPQHFLLEIFDEGNERARYNLTSDEPVWILRDLEWGVRFRLAASAVNAKGNSARLYIDDILFSDPEKRTASEASLGLSPAVGCGAGAGAALTALLLACGIVARVRRSQANTETHKHAQLEDKLPADQDDAEPDLIPNNYCDIPAPTASVPKTSITPETHTAAMVQSNMMCNGPGSSWTWGPRPRDLTIAASPNSHSSGSVIASHTLGRSSSAQLRSINTDILNVDAIKEKFLDQRIPESCV